MIDEVKIFLSYSHKDKALKDQFLAHLSTLTRTEKNLILWTDDELYGGHHWDTEINNNLLNAELILLLISPDFIQSDYCYNKELRQAIEMYKERKAVVVPIGLRSIDLTDQPFTGLQMLPVNPLFVASWTNIDEGFTNVIQGLRKTLNYVLTEMRNNSPIIRKDEIRKLIEKRKFEDACDKLFGFVSDFHNEESLKDRISIMKAEYCDIMEDKKIVDYSMIRQAIRKLFDEIFVIIKAVIEALKKTATWKNLSTPSAG